MRKLSVALLVSTVLFMQGATASEDWGYTGNVDENHWGNVGYPICATGKQQSPINITKAVVETSSEPLVFHNSVVRYRMKLDTHNLYAFSSNAAANTLQYNGDSYKLLSFHVHVPAEHQIDGKQYAMEGHFIHENSAGRPVVIGVFFKLGAPNPQFKHFVEAVASPSADLSVSEFFRNNTEYYVYDGSLTAPPCGEGLTWIVFSKPLEVSYAQIQYFKQHVIPNNSRTPQPLNDRVVTFHQ